VLICYRHINIKCIYFRINGLHKRRDELWSNNGFSLNADCPEDGLDAFINYLDYISDENGSASLVLVAHNCFGFDAKVLCNQLVYHNICVPENLIGGFNDSLLVAKSLYTGYKGYFTLNNLMSVLLGRRQSTVHDAKEDARCTRDIIRSMAKRNDMTVADCVDRIQQKVYDTVYEAAEDRMQEFGQYY
jgi:DNA polymerase III epsilon subunit-like protein